MMSSSTKSKLAQESEGFSAVDCAHRQRLRAPDRIRTLLHFKGFAGGVPINTETAAVNPRVGVE